MNGTDVLKRISAETDRLLVFENSWFLANGNKRALLFGVLMLLAVGVALLVYRSGGTVFVFPHFAYVVIIAAAAAFGAYGGILIALFLGLLLGPYMPLDVVAGTPQASFNWMFRLGVFMLAGAFTGGMFDMLKRHLRRLHAMAYCDPESALPNRHALELEADAWLADERSHNRERVFLLQCKIVNFPEIVSVTGYPAIAELMVTLHEKLERKTGFELRLYRTGTDEFALLTKLPKTRESVELLRDALHVIAGPHSVNGLSAHVDVTAGIASMLPDENHGSDHHDGETLVRQGMLAMHNSWAEDKELAIFHKEFEPDPARMRLLGEARAAMREHQLELFYQPKIDARTHQVTGAEALIRWRHPELGLVPPVMFIPQLERTSLINPCTLYVLELALAQAAEWQSQGRQLNIAVNISVRNLQANGFLKRVRTMVNASGVPPEQLDLEITESAIARLGRSQLNALADLREAGFEISVDDFGTGYSSLAYLKSLPVTQIKIDQCFVRHLATDATDRQIVLASISLAQRLKLKTVAEGVEDAESAGFLISAGCDKLQGYYFARPMPANDFCSWLDTPVSA